ncbi:MAG: YihY/virulence factor BrkB family protein [Sphingobacteriales bacterium JAD_PAG50586_3]|nr:MAG: YihY/virulence factor BrkB family protein [Sphingobacteriales bacterium JAD_PAG50586_3]
MKKLIEKIKGRWGVFMNTPTGNILKNTFTLFQKHDTSTQSAALSYYTLFSIAPMLLIVISLAGVFLGREAVEGEITNQLSSLISVDSALTIQKVIKSAYKPGENWMYTVVAIVLLLLGATGVFGQFRVALNTIWDVKPSAKKPVAKFFLSKVFSIAMIAALAFLLLVSLVAQSALSAFSGILRQYLSDFSMVLVKIVDIGLTLGVTTLLFAMVYRYMSDARPQWKTVWIGSFATTILFGFGKYAIGLYLGQSSIASTYGASGSIIILILWVYYSSQIVFLGAEFTHAISIQKGIPLDPTAVEKDKDIGISTANKKVLKTVKTPTRKLKSKAPARKRL